MNQRLAVCLAIVLCLAALVAAAEDRPTERVSPAPQCNPNAVVWRTPEPPKAPQAGDVWVDPKDGMEMVYIAPGEFILGTSDAEIDAWLKEQPGAKREWFKAEQPQCRVNLPGYWIGRMEVTTAQYLRFVQATGHPAPRDLAGEQVSAPDDFPVVFIDWDDARAYCEWAGGRLPTELQWEKAARGTDERVFPWGNQWDVNRCRNFELVVDEVFETGIRRAQGDEQALRVTRVGPTAVGSYLAGASPYGCADMAGNVYEWCADWYDETAYQRYAKGDLTPSKTGKYNTMVLRGGSWGYGDPHSFRCATRYSSPLGRRSYRYGFGFRCARGLP